MDNLPVTPEQNLEQPVAPPPPKINPLYIFGGLFIMALILTGGIFIGKNLNTSQKIPLKEITPSPSFYPSPTATPTLDPTANWKTYTNDGISFQYPSDWKTDSGTNAFKQGDMVSVYTSIQYDAKVSDQNFLFTAAKPVQTTLGLRDWIDQQNILVPYPGNEAPRLSKDATLGGESAIRVDRCGEGCFSFVYSKHNDKIYAVAYPSGIPTLEKRFDQILSTFKFLDNKQNPEQSCLERGGRWIAQYNECESESSPNLTAEWCTSKDGKFADCSSACRHDPNVIAGRSKCAAICVKVCKFN